MNALNHRGKAIGAIETEVFGEIELLKNAANISRENFPSGLARIQRQQNSDQTLDNLGIAICAKFDHRGIAISNIGYEPHLAHTPLYEIGINFVFLIKRRQFATEFNNISVAIFPICENIKILHNAINRNIHKNSHLNTRAISRAK